MLTSDELRRRIGGYVEAVNSRQADRVAALFAEDAVMADPVSNPAKVGRAAVAAFFADGIGASDSWAFSAEKVHTCADHVAVDFRIAVETGGSTMTIQGIEVFVVDEDGLFTSLHAYWDEADLTIGQ
jgi:steroid delta-isomerase